MDPQLKLKNEKQKAKETNKQKRWGNESVVNREEMDGGHMRPTDVY